MPRASKSCKLEAVAEKEDLEGKMGALDINKKENDKPAADIESPIAVSHFTPFDYFSFKLKLIYRKSDEHLHAIV